MKQSKETAELVKRFPGVDIATLLAAPPSKYLKKQGVTSMNLLDRLHDEDYWKKQDKITDGNGYKNLFHKQKDFLGDKFMHNTKLGLR